MSIIKNLSKIKALIKTTKGKNKKVILAEGCFDVLHVGHIRYLQSAKKQGGVLFVAVNSDKVVKMLKGRGRPVFPVNERMEMINSVEGVDYVFEYGSSSSNKLLNDINPDVYAKGTDYTKKGLMKSEGITGFDGKIVIVGDKKTHASSEITSKIK
ncbi:MAG: adenylyltransferase/cytidyltransferase family protein [Elusimicrobia bacterium]|nr:adenylyltransferase/cytidyltransferase family protein [Elusimicrobiota bacterium]